MKKNNQKNINRRETLKIGSLVGLTSAAGITLTTMNTHANDTDFKKSPSHSNNGNKISNGWSDYSELQNRIKSPIFKNQDFLITNYGAVANSIIEATDAIKMAIEACHSLGGGRVVVPVGDFLTGPIVLKSNVNLHIVAGATLKFITDPEKYPLVFTRWEGIECMNFCPLIYAFEQENIAVTGRGTLDGQATKENWWDWKRTHWQTQVEDKQRPDARKLIAMGEKGIPVAERVFGYGHYLRPSFIQPYRCRDILIENVKIINSPMWEIHPVLSRNITIRGLNISSHGPNNDGCDPESCKDVLIENCVFDVGDDCIAIKSGKNNDGRRINVASENIIIRHCQMKDGHGGIVLGSECSGHIRNVFIEHCEMDSIHLDRAFRFKNNATRGGIIENIFARHVRIGRVGEAVLTIDLLYEEGAKGSFNPVVRNIQLDHIQSSGSPRVMYIASIPGAEIDHIDFSNCEFRGVEASEIFSTTGSIGFNNVVIEPKFKPSSLSSRKGEM